MDENRIFWYALLVAILRKDLTADDAMRLMGIDKIGAASNRNVL